MRWPPLLVAVAFMAPALGADDAVSVGKELALRSPLAWDVRDSIHPSLGPVRLAYTIRPIQTSAGSASVYSRAYLSCQKGVGKLAIELVNATSPAEPIGLRPSAEPRLVCHRPSGGAVEKEDLLASWETNEVSGDVLTRGLRAFPLRECVSIAVIQEVLLPAEGRVARVEFDLLPYARELDAIFVACGERSAYAPQATGPVLVAAKAPVPAEKASAPAAAESEWQAARVTPRGKTNVRAGPSLDSAVVTQLEPGANVLVQRSGGQWWRAKPARGAPFEGYIRQDRLVFSRAASRTP